MNDITFAELQEVAEWLDELYVRLQGAEQVFSMKVEIDALRKANVVRVSDFDYRESLQNDLEKAAQIGIAARRPMEHCGCLLEALNDDDIPREFLLKARSEINNLAVLIRQEAIDLDSSEAPKPTRKQPEKEVTKYVRKNIHKYRNAKEAVRAFVEIKGLPETRIDKLYGDLNNDLRHKPLKKGK